MLADNYWPLWKYVLTEVFFFPLLPALLQDSMSGTYDSLPNPLGPNLGRHIAVIWPLGFFGIAASLVKK
jgi:hypothetical protein